VSTDIDVLKLEFRPHLKRSVTTGAGNVAGTTLVDTGLTEPDDFWNGMAILIRTAGAVADCSGQLRRVVDWDLATNTLTVNVPFTDPLHPADPKIEAGVQYVMFFPTIFKTEDQGTHTNPRRYEKENGFRSPVVARAGGVATALWTIATVPPRTAGQVSTMYTLTIENATGAAVTGWLEIAGVAITVPFHVGNNDSVVIDFPAGFDLGDNDVNCNASVNGVNFQIVGTEA